jgi:hypothetical protein
MRERTRVWLMGSVSLLIAISADLSAARGQQPVRPAGAVVVGPAAGHSTELMIAHALDMALDGSELQLVISQAGGPVTGARTDAGVTRTGGAGGAGTGATEPGRGGLIQLQHRARRSFQESYEMMKASNRLLRAAGEERAERAAASRLYAASNLYVNTLYTLGRQTFGWQAGWEPTDRSEEGGAGQAATARGPKLSTGDIATITLINHAVKESLGAFELSQSLHDQAAGDRAGQQLREHALLMAAESRQSIERILASLNESRGTTETTPSGGAAGAVAKEGWSGTQVHALAQQAREVIRVFDELCGQAGGAPGAVRGNQ